MQMTGNRLGLALTSEWIVFKGVRSTKRAEFVDVKAAVVPRCTVRIRVNPLNKGVIYVEIDNSVDYRKMENEIFEKQMRIKALLNRIEMIEKENDELKDRINKQMVDLKYLSEQIDSYENSIFTEKIQSATPIQIATDLIEQTTHIEEHTVFGMNIDAKDVPTFEISELRQIAEHLLVYCNNNEVE